MLSHSAHMYPIVKHFKCECETDGLCFSISLTPPLTPLSCIYLNDPTGDVGPSHLVDCIVHATGRGEPHHTICQYHYTCKRRWHSEQELIYSILHLWSTCPTTNLFFTTPTHIDLHYTINFNQTLILIATTLLANH